ncbi:circularly permuted type 2 ATP-grasp protein [Conexibacter sp. JD483]|uniref:circularly permuted type 2 ATP-grasp protein n=1 Tax=unclassified Conexibacter TaxID=2627773 RepID=UPI0027239416|nr:MULTISPECIES: circularly permuted type 2 ATP-grasp protein [unclassified Conexibacter]MDO8187898.1 circularly permuted type 2 ATP-grasp protein [Conexibacter sp. CPCC 205706]MDO8198651.1 circularly permuted type 2 ATP-grasp protein [Conexibacter sp. CPCC 205762]MDR9369691.1 circularly permuted type 2 ATP-grasp protein [Conexibacter sp. JD483]
MIAEQPHGPLDGYDEAYASDGVPRAEYESVLGALGEIDLGALRRRVWSRMAAVGATFGTQPFGVDPVPRILAAGEWQTLAAGLRQRVRALNAFVHDAYGERRIVAAGVVPAHAIDQAEGYEPDLRGRLPAGAIPIGVAGLDVVRDVCGTLRVLEDNLRMPSGFAYAVAAREAVVEALPAGVGAPRHDLAAGVAPALARTLRDAAPHGGGDEPVVVLLSEGASASTWYEHATAARWLGIPAVTRRQLRRRGPDVVALLPDGRERRVDVVYRRLDEERLRDDRGRPTWLAELLLEPWLAGRIGVVNAFGTGVADDKLAHAFVEGMVRFYLGEEPLLQSVPTLDPSDPAVRARVLADPRAHVVKPRAGEGGRGVVVCAHADAADVRAAMAALEREPEQWVAQETVALSHHPTVVAGGRLAPRHIDLRPFVFATRGGETAVPGGLTRVAWEAGALVVNSSQDGGAKDTWVLR